MHAYKNNIDNLCNRPLGFIVTATSLATHASATRFGITLCSSLDTMGGKACLPTDKAPGPVGFTR